MCRFELFIVWLITFSLRYAERSVRWLFFPNDTMILAESERVEGARGGPLAAKSTELAAMSANGSAGRSSAGQLEKSHSNAL